MVRWCILLLLTLPALAQEEEYYDHGADFAGKVAMLTGPAGRIVVVSTASRAAGKLDLTGRPTDAQRFGWEGRGGFHRLTAQPDGTIRLHWHLDLANTPGYWDVDLTHAPDGRVTLVQGFTGAPPTPAMEAPTLFVLLDHPDAGKVLRRLLSRVTATPDLPLITHLLPRWLPGEVSPPSWVIEVVDQLDADDFRAREAASAKLRQADPRALRRLRRTQSLTPEQSARVDAVLVDPMRDAPGLLRLAVAWVSARNEQ